MSKQSYIYIITNTANNVLYIGVTSDLVKRIYEHKNKIIDGFSKKYNLYKLVYFECFDDINNAIAREKQLKNWHKEWKYNLINEVNKQWNDLYESII
jgi:putative endonuclease